MTSSHVFGTVLVNGSCTDTYSSLENGIAATLTRLRWLQYKLSLSSLYELLYPHW
jgi:hypothetical protein